MTGFAGLAKAACARQLPFRQRHLCACGMQGQQSLFNLAHACIGLLLHSTGSARTTPLPLDCLCRGETSVCAFLCMMHRSASSAPGPALSVSAAASCTGSMCIGSISVKVLRERGTCVASACVRLACLSAHVFACISRQIHAGCMQQAACALMPRSFKNTEGRGICVHLPVCVACMLSRYIADRMCALDGWLAALHRQHVQ